MKKMTKYCQCVLTLLTLSLATDKLWAQPQERAANAGSERRQKKSVAAEPADANGWYEQARRHAARGNLELAIAAYEKFLRQTEIQKDAQERLQALRQQLEQKQLAEKLERRYAQGKAASTARDWPRAVVEFETITRHEPNFRDAAKRLTEAQNKLAGENRETAVVRLYALGLAAMKWNELDEAHVAFQAVLRLDPNYRDTSARLHALENLRAQLVSGNEADALADSLKRMAQRAAAQSDWQQAVIALEALRIVRTNDREVIDRLAEARTALALTQAAQNAAPVSSSEQSMSFSQIGGLTVLMSLPALGWLFFSPSARARRLRLRHDYRSAAKIYESELTRHPSRVKYFPKLAEIYLLEGRKDDEAMKVYRNVLQLNLAANNREEINAVVAQQYLQEGRTDADAIEVLEKQLEAELHRQSRALVKVG